MSQQKLSRVLYRRLFVMLALASCVPFGCNPKEQGASERLSHEPPIVKVGVYTVQARPTPIVVTVPARALANKTAEIRPQINGLIVKNNVTSGNLVHEGDVLYEIDSDVYRANVAKAEALLTNAQAVEKRNAQLREKQAVSEQDFENAVFTRKTAEADLELAKINLDHCFIKATMDGIVDPGFQGKDLGELVQVGQAAPLTKIQQIDPIKVEINPTVRSVMKTLKEYEKHAAARRAKAEANNAGTDEAQIEKKLDKIELPMTMILADGSEYSHPGVLNEVDTIVSEDVGTVKFRGVFPNPDANVLPGMFVQVKIQTDVREDGILVPLQAVFRTAKGDAYVWVVGEDSAVERRSIDADITIGTSMLVDSGLNDGDRVVVEGTQFVYEGLKVEAEEQQIDKTKTNVKAENVSK